MKKSNRWWTILTLSISFITPLAVIVACSQNNQSENLQQEIQRLESLKFVTKSKQLSQKEFEQINSDNLANYIQNYSDLVNKPGFETRIMIINKQANRIFFKFNVKELANERMKSTKALNIDFDVKDIEPLPPINPEPSPQPPAPKPPSPSEPDIPADASGWAPITNTNAASANQYDISHADQYHFNRPYYQDNKVTLQQNGSASGNKPTPGKPSQPNVYAKEGWMPTKQHAQLAKQVFSVGFAEDGGIEQTGTAWILDYKLTEDGSYPLTWYFGTNAHVIDDLRVDNEPIYKEKFATWDPVNQKYRAINTRRLSLYKIWNPQAETEYTSGWDVTTVQLSNPKLEDDYWRKQKGFYLEKPPVKTIFQGFDFLSTSPSQFSAVNPWRDKEEYADFGVFEITFENETQAKNATNDYANWKEEDKFKYRQTDLVSHPEDTPMQIFEVGYPTDGIVRNLATNTNALLYNEGEKIQVNSLTKSPNYSTWVGLDGRFDAHIAMSDFGYAYEWMDNSQTNIDLVKTKTPYVGYGLIYGIEGSNMRGGSSGALSVDQDGYAIGVHYASDNNSAMGGTQAFVSEGYNYNGYYGNYNMPAYDLIRGGGKYQKASYYDNLVKIYGKDPNFKTRLFPNGLTSRY